LPWAGRAEEAEKELRLALAEDPNHPMANFYLGAILLKGRKAKEAIPLFQISAAADPNLLIAQFELGKCYMQEGQFEEALRVLSKVVELESESRMGHYPIAQVYAQLKNDEKRKYHLAIFERLNKAENEKRLKRSARLNQLEELDKQLSSPTSSASPQTVSPAGP
jgi:predicted Zn-dependent protease